MTIMTITRLNLEKCSRVAQLQTYYTNRGAAQEFNIILCFMIISQSGKHMIRCFYLSNNIYYLSSLFVQWHCVVIV